MAQRDVARLTGPAHERQAQPSERAMRKLDLILHHNDGLEYDEGGCFPCIPRCRKPVYEAGQIVTGYLLVRPIRKLYITGFSVTFGGRFETHWTEGSLHWGSYRVFYSETSKIIDDRVIALDCKWYRFDFEYQLPKGLPTSFKEKEGAVRYYAYGTVVRPDGSDMETFDTHFNVRCGVDIDHLPMSCHTPAHRKKMKIYGAGDDEVESEQELSGEYTDHSSLGSGEPHVLATLCLNSLAFVMGRHVIADVTVENHTASMVLCTLRFEQVFVFEAHSAKEYRGKSVAPVYYTQNRCRTRSRDVCRPSVVKVPPHSIEAHSCMFDVPDGVPSTPFRFTLSKDKVLLQRDPLIRVKYVVKLVLTPQSAPNDSFNVPLEVKIGTADSRTRVHTLHTPSTQLSRDTSSSDQRDLANMDPFLGSMDSSPLQGTTQSESQGLGGVWDCPPDDDDGPPLYTERISTSV